MNVASLLFAGAAAAPSREGPAREGAPRFSYAFAAAAVERNASQALKAHGSKPETAASEPRSTQEAAIRGQAAEQQAANVSASKESNESPVTRGVEPAAPATQETMSVAASAATPSATPAVARSASSGPMLAKSAGIAAAREAAPAKLKHVAKPALPPEAPAVKEAFAEILARRLEKFSFFDIRLDPPDLGRVEGRLSIADDGKAVLSLSFDNQNAFDLYARDEAALREALIRAGLEFAAGDFAFTFHERRAEFDAPLQAETVAADNLFYAGWSAGALDIRI